MPILAIFLNFLVDEPWHMFMALFIEALSAEKRVQGLLVKTATFV
jgi:hypothetical protein